MADANHPDPPDEDTAQPSATASPRPLARRFSRRRADDGTGDGEDETHEGSVALLAAWG